jgi:Flp pilus assembly protein TadG
MKRRNGKLKRNEKGNGLLEFAAVSIVIIPLFFGMVGAGIQLGRMNEAVQICRDAAHMYARGIDFSQVGNQNILVSLATGSGMTVNGGSGVVMMSQIIQVYQADCTAAGLTAGQCSNLNQLVFVNRLVTGNSGLRSSNYGTPPAALVNARGNIAASDYLTKSTLVVTGSLAAELTNSGLTLNDGDIAYLTEFYESTPDLSFLGAGGAGGVYAKAIF